MKDFLTNSVFFGAVISLVAYEIGTLLKKKFKLAIFNPLLIAVICVMAVLILFHIDYDTYNEGGQYISYLLTPATVSLAVPLYRQIELLKNNIKAVAAGIQKSYCRWDKHNRHNFYQKISGSLYLIQLYNTGKKCSKQQYQPIHTGRNRKWNHHTEKLADKREQQYHTKLSYVLQNISPFTGSTSFRLY